MAIFLWISSDREVHSVLPWGRWLAKQLDQDLNILCYGGAFGAADLRQVEVESETENLLVRALLEKTLKSERVFRIRGKDCLSCLSHDEFKFDSLKESYFMSGRQGRKALSECHDEILSMIDSLGLRWLILRGNEQTLSHAKLKILVPTSGGDDSQAALQLIKQLDENNKISMIYACQNASEKMISEGHRSLEMLASSHSIEQFKPNLIVRPADSVQQAIMDEIREGYNLVVIGTSNENFVSRLLYKSMDEELFLHSQGSAILVVHNRSSSHKKRSLLDEWLSKSIPQLDREQRINLYQHLRSGTVSSYDFVSLIVLSTAIAALGLIQNSVAIIIGAMLVAPLMTPMLGAGLAIVQGNLMLLRAATVSIGLGFLLSLLIGYCMGIIIPSATLSEEILARTKPNILDLFVALFSGIAAAYSTARPGLMGALPGVAIAAALVPPIASAGIVLALGSPSDAFGAASLFGINLVLIILASAITLYCMGIRPAPDLSNQRIWARRSIQILGLIALLISFLLGIRMFSGLPEDYSHLRQNIAGVISSDYSISDLKISHSEDRLILNLELASPHQRSASEISSLAAEFRKFIPVNATLKIKITQLWVDRPIE